MLHGELNEKGGEYQSGHATGSRRAYNNAIGLFQADKRENYTKDQIIAILERGKRDWANHCNTYGMGEEKEDEEI